MSLHELLNILVLTLSVATVFITLLTYLVHKIRQLPKSDSQEPSLKMDGIFFKRYLGVESNLDGSPANQPENSSIFRRAHQFSRPMFFFSLCLILFLTIGFERTLTQWRKSNLETQKSEIYKSRIAQGLLKEYDLYPERINPELIESISKQQNENTSKALASLNSRKIVLLQNPESLIHNRDFVLAGIRQWKKFFELHKIEFKIVSSLSGAENFDIVILPEAKSLTLSDRIRLLTLAKSGVGILATGPIGLLDQNGNLSPRPWGTEIWGLEYHSSVDAKSYFLTLFSGGVHAPWWEIPPGLLLNWFPVENSFQYTSSAKEIMAFESNYQGLERNHNSGSAYVRGIFKSKQNLRMTWLALDPPDLEKMIPADQFYISSLLIESLLWTSGVPIAKIGLWKSGSSGAFVASVDSEDKFTNANSLLTLFKKEGIPASFFVVSNLLKESPDLSLNASSKYELASHTDDHAPMEGKPLPNQFEHIQKSRFDIEFLWGRKVQGFRPPEEGFDQTTLNAILQNRLTYIFGAQDFHRFSPVSIADGKLFYFPRSANDDFRLNTKVGIYTEDQATQSLLDDCSRITNLGDAHFLSLHTQINGTPEKRKIVKTFIQKISSDSIPIWKSNFSDVLAWWQDRQNLELVTELLNPEQIRITIINKNNHSVENVAIILDDRAERNQPNSNRLKRLASDSQANSWLIDKIEPGEEINFLFSQESSIRQPASKVEKGN